MGALLDDGWTGALLLRELETVQAEFLDRRMLFDATLVSLDLAVALFESGRSEPLKTPRSFPSSRPAA